MGIINEGADTNMQINLPERIQMVWIVTFLLILCSICMPYAEALPSTTVTVDPETITVGEEGVPPPTDSFKVNVTVHDVENLYGWQIKLYFDPAILNCTAAEYPADHVFAGKQFMPVNAVIKNDSVLFGATLYGEDVFNGTGTLCQITFIGESVGDSSLDFDANETYLLDFDLNDIQMTTEQGSITVIPEFPSWLITPLLIITTLVAAILRKTLRYKKATGCPHH